MLAAFYLLTRPPNPRAIGIVWLEPHISKAEAAAPKETHPNERWITLKPHGADHPDYVRVKVRVTPDGAGNVISGPKELRGLRLTRLATPEELKQREQARAKTKQRRQDEAPEQRQKRKELQEGLEQELAAVRRQALEAATELTTDEHYAKLLDPELAKELTAVARQAQVEGGGKLAPREAAKRMRQTEQTVNRLVRNVYRNLAIDDEIKELVLGSDLEVPASDIPGAQPSGRGHPGYAPTRTAEAEAKGFTKEDAKSEGEQFFWQRFQETLAVDPERAGRMVEARERMRAMHRAAKPVREALKEALPTPEEKPKPADLAARAESARRLLLAHRAQRELKRRLRIARLEEDPEAIDREREALARERAEPRGGPFDVGWETIDPEVAAELNANVENLAAEELTRSFLGELESEPATGWDVTAMRRAMRGHHALGAYAHLNNVALSTLGSDVMDRTVLDVLGVEAGAQLMAHAIRRDVGDVTVLARALEEHHDQASIAAMQQAMADAEAARNDAAGVDIPPISSATDAAVVTQLIEAKKSALEKAHKALGVALGQVEGGAALNLALQRPIDELRVNLGATDVPTAATNLRAMGLEREDYAYHRDDDGNLWATITREGMDRLTPQLSPAERELAADLAAIKRGDQDEADWLPKGFVRYNEVAFDRQPPLPEAFARNPGYNPEQPAEEVVKDILASRLAEGWSPAEVSRLLGSEGYVRQFIPDDRREEFDAARAAILPTTIGREERTAKDGTTYFVDTPVDYANLATKHPELQQRLEQLADDWLRENRPGQPGYADQQLPDNATTREALYRTLMDDPSSQVAFKPLGELTPQDQRAVRQYYGRHILGMTPEQLADADERAKAALKRFDDRNPAPPKWDAGLFGDAGPVTLTLGMELPSERQRALRAMGLRRGEGQEYVTNADGTVTLTDAGKEALVPPPAGIAGAIKGLDQLNPEYLRHEQTRGKVASDAADLGDLKLWADYTNLAGGPHKAHEAIQAHMRGAFVKRFADYYGRLGGSPLRLGRREQAHGELLLSMANPELYKQLRELRGEQLEQARAREHGRYAFMGGAGAAIEAVQRMREAERAMAQQQGALFGGAETDEGRRQELIPHLESPQLPAGVENRLGLMLRGITGSITPGTNPVELNPNLTMGAGTRFVAQQRAIKAVVAGKKQLIALGVGSGKTNVAIGAFTELQHRGLARKGIFVVPSIVRNQFGEEMAKVLEPGKYAWLAGEANYEQRLAAYRQPELHMAVVTHQALRDDLFRMMAEHHGYDTPDDAVDSFMAADSGRRKRMLQSTLDANQINLDYLAADEAHDFLGRAGKAESQMQAVLDTAMELAPYGIYMTGSPLKNDASEYHDWLKKLEPERFASRAEFMRRYGTDAFVNKEAFKRLMERYAYHNAAASGVSKKVVWGNAKGAGDGPASPSGHELIEVSAHQKSGLEQVASAFERGRRARRNETVDVEAMRILSPESFSGVPESEHRKVAQSLQSAIGTLRQAAENRVLNATPAEHNSKVQHVVSLAEERRGKGGVVFAHNLAGVQELAGALRGAGHRVATLTGADNAQDKAKTRRRFRAGEIDIIVSSDAGSIGANLQHRGEWVVNYDLPMTQKTLEQRNGRIDRIGQARAIELHHLMTNTEHDQANYERLERKRLLGGIMQGPWESMDDTGLALNIKMAGVARPAPRQDPAAESQMGLFG